MSLLFFSSSEPDLRCDLINELYIKRSEVYLANRISFKTCQRNIYLNHFHILIAACSLETEKRQQKEPQATSMTNTSPKKKLWCSSQIVMIREKQICLGVGFHFLCSFFLSLFLISLIGQQLRLVIQSTFKTRRVEIRLLDFVISHGKTVRLGKLYYLSEMHP